MPAEVREIFEVRFHLRFDIADGNNLVKFGGNTFQPARKVLEISGRISQQIAEKFRELRFKFCDFF